jgi:hypothetical protein
VEAEENREGRQSFAQIIPFGRMLIDMSQQEGPAKNKAPRRYADAVLRTS